MARAKRHYIPGQVWCLTHRCHKREFLFKLVMDRRRWVQWLFEARKRYGLVILNYTVTANHIHLLVVDDEDRDVLYQIQSSSQPEEPDRSSIFGKNEKEHFGRIAIMPRLSKMVNIF